MFKWFIGTREKKPAKDEPTSRNLWETEFSLVGKGGLDAEQVIAYVDELKTRHQASQDAQESSVRSIVQTALTDAHDIADRIRIKAERDAETTTSNLVAQATRDAEAIRHKAETEAKQTAEKITTAADKSARMTEAEAQDKATIFLLRAREQIEREIIGEFNEAYSRLTAALGTLLSEGNELRTDLQGRREELLKSNVFELTVGDVPLIGSPAEAHAEASDVEEAATTADAKEASTAAEETPVAAEDAAIVESGIELPDDADAVASGDPVASDDAVAPSRPVASNNAVASDDEAFTELTEEESQALYIGEVDIVVPTPVDAKMMSQLHRYLQTTPEIKLVRTAGSMGRGTVVTIAIDKPVPLIDALASRIPEAAIALERRRGDGSPGLPGATKKIRMVPKTN